MEIGDCVLLLAGHSAPVTALAVAASGSLLVSASADRTARVWELEKGQCLGILQGWRLSCLCILPVHGTCLCALSRLHPAGTCPSPPGMAPSSLSVEKTMQNRRLGTMTSEAAVPMPQYMIDDRGSVRPHLA